MISQERFIFMLCLYANLREFKEIYVGVLSSIIMI